MTDLARRATACKHWRLLPSMRDTDGWICVNVRDNDETWWVDEDPVKFRRNHTDDACELRIRFANADTLPDLTDPSTLGCLLALVREAHDDHGAYCYARGKGEGFPGWYCRVHALQFQGDTEAGALIAALEAVP